MSAKDTDLTGLFKSDAREEFKKAAIEAAYELQVHGDEETLNALADENDRLREENAKLLATLEHSATHKALGAMAIENDRLRDDLTVADDALKLAREAHQVTIDAENRLRAVKCESCTDATPRLCLSCADFEARTLRAQLAEAVALLARAPIGGSDAEILAWAWVKLRGAL